MTDENEYDGILLVAGVLLYLVVLSNPSPYDGRICFSYLLFWVVFREFTTVSGDSRANYTKEQVDIMVAKYKKSPTRKTVDSLAEELNKSTQSIIAKLTREGVYVSKSGRKTQQKKQKTYAGDSTTEEELENNEEPKLQVRYPLLEQNMVRCAYCKRRISGRWGVTTCSDCYHQWETDD